MFQSFSYNTFYDGVSVVSVQTKVEIFSLADIAFGPCFF